MGNPLCPVTGEPAVRLVQWVKAGFLRSLWKHIFKVDVRRDFDSVERFGLWQSSTGLYFFDPMIEGSHEFYQSFYGRLQKSWFRNLPTDLTRDEFLIAARYVEPGARVLDVGCGFANFRNAVPHAAYVGLDPHFAEGSPIAGVYNQTLRQHLANHRGFYDVACSFQVLEHLASPLEMFADMVRVVRPGGVAIVGVPHHPSAMTRIPNFLLNAPPHHLTWWTEKALTAMATRCGANLVAIERAAWSRQDVLLYWMERCSPIRCGDIHYRNAWHWHAAAVIGYAAARLAYAMYPMPAAKDEGIGLVMVARRNA